MTQSALNWSHRQYLPHVWPHVLHGSQWLSLSLNYISITQAALNWSLRQYLPPVLHLFQWLGQYFTKVLGNTYPIVHGFQWLGSSLNFISMMQAVQWLGPFLYGISMTCTVLNQSDRNLLFLQIWWNFPKFPHLIYRDTSSSLTFYFSEK